MSDLVFLGPSLPAAEAAALLPGARILPPVGHGDLLRLAPGPDDRVLIVDGFFMHRPPVRHREILLLLERGVTVAGSSSMGALRAAELWQYGMRGFGDVFELYRDGVVTGDHEVAVVHGLDEDDYRSLSVPLVNIRIAVREAIRAGAIGPDEGEILLKVAAGIPFRLLTWRSLALQAGSAMDGLRSWLGDHPVDAKADDARRLLRAAAAGDPRLCPAGPGDEPVRHVHTTYLEGWRSRYEQTGGVSERELLVALRVLHPGFAAAHRARVLAGFSGAAPDDPALEELALLTADRLGRGVPVPDGSWLTADEADLPAPEATLRLLVRSLGAAETRQISPAMIPPGLRRADVLATAREAVVTAKAIEASLTRRQGRPARFRAEIADAVLAAQWGCDPAGLTAAAWDRGFRDLDQLRELAGFLIGYLRVLRAPWFPRPDPSRWCISDQQPERRAHLPSADRPDVRLPLAELPRLVRPVGGPSPGDRDRRQHRGVPPLLDAVGGGLAGPGAQRGPDHHRPDRAGPPAADRHARPGGDPGRGRHLPGPGPVLRPGRLPPGGRRGLGVDELPRRCRLPRSVPERLPAQRAP
ncbi:TfuA-like protein [Actinoplanes sp. CA-252034]|uniref:TfuA-like protein n=1 Tax=Actinoplanes sp. CA-252034 TaxID=3239906 RepID=UPI003D97E50D